MSQSYFDYNVGNILMVLVFKNLCNIKNMNEMTKEFNINETIKKFEKILDNGNLDEIPYYVTINENGELEKVRKNIVKELIRKKHLMKTDY